MNRLISSFLLIFGLIFSVCSQEWKPAKVAVMTTWGEKIDPAHVLEEYPRPQMQRNDWINLNGIWEFTRGTYGDTYNEKRVFDKSILVPFPVESALSGVMEVDAKNDDKNYWYRRTFTVPKNYKGKELLLHLGAVDWLCEVYVNGKSVGTHEGGYDAFSFNITPYLQKTAQQELVIKVFDSQWAGGQPHGKQSLNPNGIWYTPVTGIWQTVWLEPVAKTHLSDFLIVPDIDNEQMKITLMPNALSDDMSAVIRVLADKKEVTKMKVSSFGEELQIPVKNPRLWSPESPFLYDVEIELQKDGKTVDIVKSYAGMRKIALERKDGKPCIYLNNKPLFQYGVLDQGWWPDGLYTAPSDEALEYDVKMVKEMGFNMIRKHVKVEPARWYYHCDKLGMLVWQDIPNATTNTQRNDWVETNFVREAHNIMNCLKNTPSIITWVAFNEGWGQFDALAACEQIRTLDSSRLVDHASGWFDQKGGDILSLHYYFLKLKFKPESKRAAALTEFGGYSLSIPGHSCCKKVYGYKKFNSTGTLTYGYIDLIRQTILPAVKKGIGATVYTQLSDIEEETNGIYTYDREICKIDPDTLRKWNRALKEAGECKTYADHTTDH